MIGSDSVSAQTDVLVAELGEKVQIAAHIRSISLEAAYRAVMRSSNICEEDLRSYSTRRQIPLSRAFNAISRELYQQTKIQEHLRRNRVSFEEASKAVTQPQTEKAGT